MAEPNISGVTQADIDEFDAIQVPETPAVTQADIDEFDKIELPEDRWSQLRQEQLQARIENRQAEEKLQDIQWGESQAKRFSPSPIIDPLIKGVAQGVKYAGNIVGGVASDIVGPLAQGRFPFVAGMPNTSAALADQPTPAEQRLDERARLKDYGAVVAQGLLGIAKMSPQLALTRIGFPIWSTFGVPMAAEAYAETGSPLQAAIAGATGVAIPGAGKIGKELAAKAMAKGIESGLLSPNRIKLQKAVESWVGELGGIEAFLEGTSLPDYLAMDPEQRRQSILRNVVTQLGFGVLGLPHVLNELPSATQGRLSQTPIGELFLAVNRPEVAGEITRLADDYAARQTGFNKPTETDQLVGRIMAEGKKPEAPATFIGYQEVPKGPALPLFNLTQEAGGRPVGSTVAGTTLREAGFRLPVIPSFEQWKGEQDALQKRQAFRSDETARAGSVSTVEEEVRGEPPGAAPIVSPGQEAPGAKTLTLEGKTYRVEEAGAAPREFRTANAVIVAPGEARGGLEARAYHGTPHKFEPEKLISKGQTEKWVGIEDVVPFGWEVKSFAPMGRWKPEMLGKGEGVAAYGEGEGGYHAQEKETAQNYAENLGAASAVVVIDGKRRPDLPAWADIRDNPEAVAVWWIINKGAETAVREIKARADLANKSGTKEEAEDFRKVAEYARKLIGKRIEMGSAGNVYTTEIPDGPYLDWDKPLSEQPAEVQKAIANSKISQRLKDLGLLHSANLQEQDGQSLYFAATTSGDRKAASDYLSSLGIKGIRYLDQGSRWVKSIPEIEKNLSDARARLSVWEKEEQHPASAQQTKNYREQVAFFEKALSDAKGIKPTYNYVIFKAEDVKILERNGKRVSVEEAMGQPGPSLAAASPALLVRRAHENLSDEQYSRHYDRGMDMLGEFWAKGRKAFEEMYGEELFDTFVFEAHPTGLGLRVMPRDPHGSNRIYVDPVQLAINEGVARQTFKNGIRDAIVEEGIHAYHLEALQRAWKKAGRPGTFEKWMDGQAEAIYDQMSPELRETVARLRLGDKAVEDWKATGGEFPLSRFEVGMEYVRMLIQREKGVLTEAAFNKSKLLEAEKISPPARTLLQRILEFFGLRDKPLALQHVEAIKRLLEKGVRKDASGIARPLTARMEADRASLAKARDNPDWVKWEAGRREDWRGLVRERLGWLGAGKLEDDAMDYLEDRFLPRVATHYLESGKMQSPVRLLTDALSDFLKTPAAKARLNELRSLDEPAGPSEEGEGRTLGETIPTGGREPGQVLQREETLERVEFAVTTYRDSLGERERAVFDMGMEILRGEAGIEDLAADLGVGIPRAEQVLRDLRRGLMDQVMKAGVDAHDLTAGELGTPEERDRYIANLGTRAQTAAVRTPETQAKGEAGRLRTVQQINRMAWVPNRVVVGNLLAGWRELPEPAKNLLGAVRGRVNVLVDMQSRGEGLGLNEPDLVRMIESMTDDPYERTQIAYNATEHILDAHQERAGVVGDLRKLEKEALAFDKQFAKLSRKAAEAQLFQGQAERILSEARDRLIEQIKEVRAKAGDAREVVALEAQLESMRSALNVRLMARFIQAAIMHVQPGELEGLSRVEIARLLVRRAGESGEYGSPISPGLATDMAAAILAESRDLAQEIQIIRATSLLSNEQFEHANAEILRGFTMARKGEFKHLLNAYATAKAKGDAARQLVVRANRDFARLMDNIEAHTQALEFMDRLLGDPDLIRNKEHLARIIGIRYELTKDERSGDPLYANPNDPEAEPLRITGGFEAVGEERNQANIQKILGWYESYLEQAATNPNSVDPWRVETVRFAKWRIETHMDQAEFHPGIGQRKKLAPGWRDPGRWMTGSLKSPSWLPKFIPGRLGRSLAVAVENMGRAADGLSRALQTGGPATQALALRAAKGHGMEDRVWLVKVLNPILFHFRRPNMAHPVSVGSILWGGHVVSQADMVAARAQHALFSKATGASLTLEDEASRQAPVLILQEHRAGPGQHIARRPVAATPLMLPQRTIGLAHELARQFAETEKLPEAEQLAERMRLLNEASAFDQAVVTHVQSFDDPTFPVKTPFREEYREVVIRASAEPRRAPHSVEELAQQVFDLRATDDMSVADIRKQIVGEIAGTLKKLGELKSKEIALNKDTPLLEVIGDENFTNNPRGDLMLPYGLYEFGLATNRQQSWLLSAVQKVYALRLLNLIKQTKDSLSQLITKYASRDLPGELARQTESRRAELAGEHFLDYEDAKRYLRWVEKLEAQFKLTQNKDTIYALDLINLFNKLQQWPVVGLLLKPVVAARNVLMSNAIRGIQVEASLQSLWPVPGAGLAVSAARNAWDVAGAVLRAIGTAAASRWAKTEMGQRAIQTVRDNPGFYRPYVAQLIEWMGRLAEEQEYFQRHRLIELSPVADIIRNAFTFAGTGGYMTGNEPGRLEKGVRGAVSLFDAVFMQTGVLAGAPSWAVGALERVGSYYAKSFARRLTGRIERNAIRAVRNRLDMGSDPRAIPLTPQELLGRRADARMKLELEEIFGSINASKAAWDYGKRVWEAKARRAPPLEILEIKMLDAAQEATLLSNLSMILNRGSFINRPLAFKTGLWQQALGKLWGYGANLGEQWSAAMARPAKDTRLTDYRFVGMQWAAIAAMMGVASAPLLDLLSEVLYGEIRQLPQLWQVDSPKDLIAVTAMDTQAFVPPLMGLMAAAVGTSASSKYSFNTGVNLLPLSIANSVKNTASAIYQAHDPVMPMVEFMRQWFPNTRVWINRLEGMAGTVEYRNSNRELRVAGMTSGVEMRASTAGTAPQLTPMSPLINGIVNALTQPGGPNLDLAMELRESAAKMRADKDDARPYQAIDKMVLARAPAAVVFGRHLSDSEQQQIMAKMSDAGKARLQANEQAFATYSTRVGGGAVNALSAGIAEQTRKPAGGGAPAIAMPGLMRPASLYGASGGGLRGVRMAGLRTGRRTRIGPRLRRGRKVRYLGRARRIPVRKTRVRRIMA